VVLQEFFVRYFISFEVKYWLFLSGFHLGFLCLFFGFRVSFFKPYYMFQQLYAKCRLSLYRFFAGFSVSFDRLSFSVQKPLQSPGKA
jgi:hypothetical protein